MKILKEELKENIYSIIFKAYIDKTIYNDEFDIDNEIETTIEELKSELQDNLTSVLKKNKVIIENAVNAKLLDIDFVEDNKIDDEEIDFGYDFYFDKEIDTNQLITILSSDTFNSNNKELNLSYEDTVEFDNTEYYYDPNHRSGIGERHYDSDYVHYIVNMYIDDKPELFVEEQENESLKIIKEDFELNNWSLRDKLNEIYNKFEYLSNLLNRFNSDNLSETDKMKMQDWLEKTDEFLKYSDIAADVMYKNRFRR